MKTYFFLASRPADAPDGDGFLGFRSAAGSVYNCRLWGTRAKLRWRTARGESMSSDVTTFRLTGDTPTIRTDMNEERFRAE